MERTSTNMGILSLLRVRVVTWWISTLFLLAVVVTPQVFSQNRVLQVVLATSPGLLLDVTRRSMAIELKRAGMEVESREDATIDGMSPIQVSSMAASTDAQYVALLRCDNVGERVRFEMALYDGGTGKTLARLYRENLPVDLDYDIIVARSARELLAEAGVWFDKPKVVQASALPPGEQGDEAPVFRQIPFLPAELPTDHQAPAPGEKGVAFSVGVAPVFVTGQASDYLKFGFLASLSFGYRIPLRSATLSLDLLGGVGILYPEDSASIIDVFLVPFGPSVRMETSSSTNLKVGVRVSLGPALLAVRSISQADLTKLVPYALGGLEVSYKLSRSIMIRLESNFTVFFEEEHPIMAFSPTFAVKW